MEEVFLRLSAQDEANERKAPGSYLDNWGSAGGTLGRLSLVSATLRRGSFGTASAENTLKKNMNRSIVYPGITAMAEDCGIQPISYYKKTEAETEFQKIKRRLSMKVCEHLKSCGRHM